MAGERDNTAYNESIVSAADKRSKKKKKNGQIISISQGSSAKSLRRKRNPFIIMSVLFLTIVLAGVAILMVHFSAELDEVNDKINTQKMLLEEMKEEETQYQMQIDKVLTDEYVKNYAENVLHMTPVKNAQKKFVFMASGDEGKILDDRSGDNVFTTIRNAFSSTFM